MKQTKGSSVKRPARPATAHLRAKVRAGRPLHKRLLVHPFTVMVLLCAGVLIAGATIRALAVGVNVTATVQAPLLSAPAVISTPAHQQHFAAPQTLVTGSCPAQSYVKLYRNAVFSGVSQCAGNSFQIQTGLYTGANELRAQAYNQTDQAGPTSPTVIAYYDPTTVTPPSTPPDTPTTLWVSNVGIAEFKQGTVPSASDNPTVSGWAPPWSQLTITFHSDPETCLTQADGLGWWTCTLDKQLPLGLHNVDIKAVTPGGDVLTLPTFSIRVSASVPAALAPAPNPPSDPLLVRADYHYQVRLGHQSTDLVAAVTGGTAPYAVTADWGDGTTTKLKRTDSAPFTLSHTYPTPSGANKNYTVLVHATDANQQTALMQLSVTVKGNGIVLISSTTTFGALLDTIQHWLWLVWPAYVVVVLMAIGYYLGEREEYRRLMAKRPARSHAGRTK